jgi:mercuric ion binding protein
MEAIAMRKTIAALLCLALAWTAADAWAAIASYRLQVDGLACPFCAYGIEKKLTALDGVDKVETHIREGAVIVTMEDGAALDEATAKRAVEAAGFTLNGFEPVEAR